MASLQSYIDDAANITTSADGRTITITGDCNIDGALDTLPHIDDGVHIIVNTSSGKLRSSAGASGVLGGGKVPLRITETATAHAYPNDNGNAETDCRFTGSTNTLKYEDILYTVENKTSRSDFDVGSTFAGTFKGFRLVQPWATGGATSFNHIYSSNFKMEVSPRSGYGYSIRNEGNAHGLILEASPNAQFAGLAIDNVDIPANSRNEGSTKGSSARLVVAPAANETFTLVAPDTGTITESTNHSTAVVELINPVRVPTRTNNWNSPAGSTMIIYRDQPFDFMSAGSAAGTLYADSQAASNGQDANVAIPQNGRVSIRVRTHYSAYTGNATGGTWTDTDSYQFYAAGMGFDKYYSGPTSIAVGTSPATRSVNLMASTLPDGTALSGKSSGAVETAADVINALKTYEVANPTYPSVSTRLVVVASGVARVSTAELVLSTTASDFIARSGNTITLQCDSGGVDASNGVLLFNLGTSYAAPSGTLNLINLPTTTSAGTSALVNITAPQSYAGLFTNAGVQLGVHDFAAAGTRGFLVPATSALANTRVGCALAGHAVQHRTIDISAGGTFNVTFEEFVEEVDFFGEAQLDTGADITGVSVSFTLTGQPTFNIPNRSVSPQAIYRALHNQFSNPLGIRFAAFGRQPIRYFIDPLAGNSLSLGADAQLRRSSSSGDSAAVVAAVYGGRGGEAVNDDRGDVIIKPGSDIGRIQRALLKDFDLDDNTAGTQSVAGLLVKIDNCASQMSPAMNAAISQLKLICQALPRHYYAPWTPGNPAVFFMRGQQRLHDVNKRNWGISNPDGNLVIEPVTGYGDFNGSTRVEASLNRENDDGTLSNYAEECTLAFRIKPDDEDGTFILNELGAMRLRLVMADGVGTLKIGHSGENNYTAGSIAAGKWNDIVLSIQRNPDNANYPYVRLSATDGGYDGNSSPGVKAVETWNTDTNEVYGSIASHTGAFYIGATSNGFKGQVASCYFHPSSTALSYVWETGDHKRAVGWDDYHQIWNGLPGDNSEGLSDDIVEDNVIRALARLTDILAKLNHSDIANAVLTQPSQAGQSADNSNDAPIIGLLKWLAENVNTTTPPAAPTKTDLGLPDRLDRDIAELKAGNKDIGAVVAGKSEVDGAVTKFYDKDDPEELVRTITTGSPTGTRTSSVKPAPDPEV